MIVASAHGSFAHAFSFPATNFTILNPDTGAKIGRSRYSIESVAGGAILHGLSRYYDGRSDIETGKLRLGTGDELPKLVEFDHTFYNRDGSIQARAHADLVSGAATCTDTTGGVASDSSAVLQFPRRHLGGRQRGNSDPAFFARNGRQPQLPSLHAFNCAPDTEDICDQPSDPIPASRFGRLTAQVLGRGAARLGWLNVIVGAFVPKLHIWFDPGNGWAFVGDEAARYYKGTKIMLVKSRGEASTAQLGTNR